MASTVNIKLVTSADTSGADRINAALGITTERERELAKMRSQFLSAAEAEVETVKNLAAESLKAAKAREQEVKAVNPWISASRNQSAAMETYRNTLSTVVVAKDQVAKRAVNLGNAMLQTSRGIQDAQYGLAGMVNNLEGIATALGLGAGVAGVVTVLAVAVQQLGPRVIEMLKSFDGAAQVRESISALQAQLGTTEPVDAATVASERYREEIRRSEQAVKDQNSAIDAQIKLLTLQAAAKRSQAEFELEQGIQDIQAQGLPQDEEAAIIAERRIQFAEQQRAAEDDLAVARLNAATEQRSNAEQAAQDAAAELASINAKIERTSRYMDLLQEEKRLRDAVSQAESDARALTSGEGPVSEDAILEARRLRQNADNALAANKSDQAALVAQGVGNLPALGAQRRLAQPRAESTGAAAETARKAAADAAAQERAQAQERAAELERERQRIGRGLRPGVFDGANAQLIADPFTGIAPLPRGAPAVPLPRNAQPPAPLGPGGFNANFDAATNATQQAALTGEQSAESVIRFAETTTSEMERLRKSNEDMKRKLTTLETRLKNQR